LRFDAAHIKLGQSSWFCKRQLRTETDGYDALHQITYIGLDNNPYLYIADTRNATLGQNGFLPGVSFSNGFDAGKQINALDAVDWRNPATEPRALIFCSHECRGGH